MFLELVKNRRSVRRFSKRPVEHEKIRLCLEAARLAPSACNAQPWKFLVFDDPVKREAICRAAGSGIYRPSGFVSGAPVVIVALNTKGKRLPNLAGRFQGKHYPLIDLGIAGEHLVLQAAELGLGTCWVGWFSARAVSRLLGLPKEEKPVALIPLGYPAEDEGTRTPRKPLEEISSFNPEIRGQGSALHKRIR
ncbi:MAG: nitroreductase family protein [PVC group bacterium]